MDSELEIRKKVIDACHRLVDEGLVARTWGNISARIDDNLFVITPSGRDYDSLKEEDLVVVNIHDCTYDGKIKPSSERGIHADAYKLRPDVNFVIHTHQFYASAVSAGGEDTKFAPLVPYGLPGTKALRRNVSNTMSFEPVNVFLLARHGALCLGKDADDAFEIAKKLEEDCKALYESTVSEGATIEGIVKPYLDDYAQILGSGNAPVCKEDSEVVKTIKSKNLAAALYGEDNGPMNFFDVKIQHLVYKYKYSKLKNKK